MDDCGSGCDRWRCPSSRAGLGGLADAAIGTAATVIIGAAVLVVTQVVVFGGTLGLDAFVDTIRWAGGITGMLAPVAAAAVWLTQPHPSEAGRVELAEYVTAYVPWVEEQRRHVWNEVARARQLPMPAAATFCAKASSIVEPCSRGRRRRIGAQPRWCISTRNYSIGSAQRVI